MARRRFGGKPIHGWRTLRAWWIPDLRDEGPRTRPSLTILIVGVSDDHPYRCPGADRPPCCLRLWSAYRSRDVAEMGVDRHGVPSDRAAALACRLAPPADQRPRGQAHRNAVRGFGTRSRQAVRTEQRDSPLPVRALARCCRDQPPGPFRRRSQRLDGDHVSTPIEAMGRCRSEEIQGLRRGEMSWLGLSSYKARSSPATRQIPPW